MEHLLAVLIKCVVDGMLTIDRSFRRRLKSVVPNIDELWKDPEGVLTRQDMVIGPKRSYAVATLLGGMLGLLLPCGIFFSWLDKPGPRPIPERVLFFAALAGAPLIGSALFWHWLRGGEMVLRAHGVVLRYRRDRVFCPWSVFQVQQGLRTDRCVVRPWPPAVPAVVHSRGYTVLAAGRAIRTKPLYFRKDGQMVLRDLYAVRLEELAGLLFSLAWLLGPDRPLASPPQCGDPIPEEMC